MCGSSPLNCAPLGDRDCVLSVATCPTVSSEFASAGAQGMHSSPKEEESRNIRSGPSYVQETRIGSIWQAHGARGGYRAGRLEPGWEATNARLRTWFSNLVPGNTGIPLCLKYDHFIDSCNFKALPHGQVQELLLQITNHITTTTKNPNIYYMITVLSTVSKIPYGFLSFDLETKISEVDTNIISICRQGK